VHAIHMLPFGNDSVPPLLPSLTSLVPIPTAVISFHSRLVFRSSWTRWMFIF